jgi:hypothetical protein
MIGHRRPAKMRWLIVFHDGHEAIARATSEASVRLRIDATWADSHGGIREVLCLG